MPSIIFNKQIVPSENPSISHNDRGFTLGHGLFETILIKNGSPPVLDYHWKRLITSAPILGISIPFSYEELSSMLSDLVRKNNLQDKLAGARLTITHGTAERGILPTHSPQPNFLIMVFECAAPAECHYSALIVNTRKNEHTAASRVKSISYLDNILAKQEAKAQQYDEAILLNTSLNVADGAISNIYMVKNNQILTPRIEDGALPGVIRSILIEDMSDLFPVVEKTISRQELLDADEVFLTNSLMGVKSINKINNQNFYSFNFANNIKRVLREKKNYI